MLECVEAGAESLGISVEQMLAETTAFRFSSTIVTNAIIERRGPRVGLLVSAGAEEKLYGDRPGLIDAGYVSPDLVLSVREPLDPDAVAGSIEALLDRGARVVAVSLDGAWRDPSAERTVRNIVRSLYPTYYVGSVRVFLSSDVSPGMAAELAEANIAVNAVSPVAAVATEAALAAGVAEAGAHLEPLEAMAEAVLELCTRPPRELSGRVVFSLPLLRELGATVHTLDGARVLPGFTL